MRLARTLIALFVTLAVLGGCAPATSPEELAVRATIERYNAMLADGYRALDMNGMTQVATPVQAESEYIHMSSLAEGGVRLDSELKKIEFVRVSIEATSAVAETRETWDYRQISRSSGKPVLVQEGLVYELAWDLQKQPDGKWLVSDVRAISTTQTSEPTVLGTITPVPPMSK